VVERGATDGMFSFYCIGARLFHYFSFLIRWVLKNSSNFQQLLPKVSGDWSVVRLLIGILKEAKFRSDGLSGELFNGR
jgi:hypothetical protein